MEEFLQAAEGAPDPLRTATEVFRLAGERSDAVCAAAAAVTEAVAVPKQLDAVSKVLSYEVSTIEGKIREASDHQQESSLYKERRVGELGTNEGKLKEREVGLAARREALAAELAQVIPFCDCVSLCP